jgi:hypothetical protein
MFFSFLFFFFRFLFFSEENGRGVVSRENDLHFWVL